MNFNYFITIEGITFHLDSPKKKVERKTPFYCLVKPRQITQRIIYTYTPCRVSEPPLRMLLKRFEGRRLFMSSSESIV
ncbi:hypothetical protein R3W88_001205 [Solanum pinnatisectum]|uniref:Uncharacterized protein n=1 Tax=Solanum pinnatisectum TaxID=50273 RepID=A0AAV9MI45_9SOLN|nr:hypothetical protein R3W88_001205 [Solanum pinnatisectum]